MKNVIQSIALLLVVSAFAGCSEAYFYRQHLEKRRLSRIETAKASGIPAEKAQIIGAWIRSECEVDDAKFKKQLIQEKFIMQFSEDGTVITRGRAAGKTEDEVHRGN